MKTKIDKLNEFKLRLENISRVADGQNKTNMSLADRQQGVAIVKEYYQYLKECQEPYGEATLSVVNDAGFGKLPNIHVLLGQP